MKVKTAKQSGAAPPKVEAPPEIQFSEQVAALAYALWEARGCPEGTPEEDWHQAEQVLIRTQAKGA